MNHEFYGPSWAENHARLGDAVARSFGAAHDTVGNALERLRARQFAAPWRQPGRQVRMPDAK